MVLDRCQLEAFAAVVETQSFERAATTLHITRGAVSQRIKSLEQSMATVLLVRSRPIEATAAGEVLMRHVKALRLLELEALRALAPTASSETRFSMAVAVNPDSLVTWFPDVLWSLLGDKRVALEVIVDDEHCADERLAKGEVMGCVSTEARAASGFASDPLGGMGYRCYATQDFIRRELRGGLTATSALSAPAVLFNRKDSLHVEYLKRQLGFTLGPFPRHYLPAPSVLLETIVHGMGYGLLPESQAAPLVKQGVLAEVEPQQELFVDLYWHHWANELEFSRSVTQRVLSAARAKLRPPRSAPEP